MEAVEMDKALLQKIRYMQIGEITERTIYLKIAKYVKNQENRQTLLNIADEELKHYNTWKDHTKEDLKPSAPLVWYYTTVARILGYTFAIKMMENRTSRFGLSALQDEDLLREVPEAQSVYQDELVHEQKLIALLDEERLHYVGSMVLGLNDALVEFTGSLAGYSFAMQSNKLISLAGLITGISATLSMASSEYLSARSEGRPDALKSAGYTGFSYLLTVVLLILPYLLLPDNMYGLALAIMLAAVMGIIALFNYYISVAKDYSFKKRFGEMAGISLGVAALSFVIGLLVKRFLGIDL
jgi:VIT1/CCC1 family predicted Fe2+/Mn2+ transporter